jgi:hypothetical protein
VCFTIVADDGTTYREGDGSEVCIGDDASWEHSFVDAEGLVGT